MTIDATKEDLVSFNDARCAFPGRDRLSLATLHRWRLHGVRGTKLETILIGNRRFTSKQAIARFIANQNSPEEPLPRITPAEWHRRAEIANQFLVAAGI